MKTFNQEKQELINGINELLEKYDEFTKDVSPKCWRTTGTHYTNLKNMVDEINNFIPITNNDREKFKEYIDG